MLTPYHSCSFFNVNFIQTELNTNLQLTSNWNQGYLFANFFSQTQFMNSSWTVCQTVRESQSVTDFGKHCSWTVYEQFAKHFAKASLSPTLANTIHGEFMSSLQNSLRKPVSHRLWQTMFMNSLWTVFKLVCESLSVTDFGKHVHEQFAKHVFQIRKKIGRNSGTRIFCFPYFNMENYTTRSIEIENSNNDHKYNCVWGCEQSGYR